MNGRRPADPRDGRARHSDTSGTRRRRSRPRSALTCAHIAFRLPAHRERVFGGGQQGWHLSRLCFNQKGYRRGLLDSTSQLAQDLINGGFGDRRQFTAGVFIYQPGSQ